ncbi:MAG: TIGR03943 family protein [Actinomycetota bacterium]|nr:TIGR03943 family protein [Actinomycetota bacterium]
MNPRIALRGAVLGVWAGFFLWLGLSGEVTRYLGPRTYWVVWFGTAVLSLAAFSHALSLRTGNQERVRRSDVAGAVLLMVPLIALIAVPNPDLGALAAGRKATGLSTFAASAPSAANATPGKLEFAEIHYASESPEYAAAIGAREGTEVELLGFVTHPKRAPEGTFALTRFYISCCAADAIPYSVFIRASDDHADDVWLRVKGRLGMIGDRFVVDPDDIVMTDEPKNPYLY